MKYFLYVRKSTESEDRQTLSIESQVSELKDLAKKERLKIVNTFKETKSAKAPGKRPIFNKMIQQIEEGKADGIICWKIDRLARNPVDGGKISWLLQQGIIKHIRAFDRHYYPEDNVLIMNVDLGVANQYILDLKRNIERGLRAKVKKGWRPGLAPIGYKNDSPATPRGQRKIFKDQTTFDQIKKCWKLLLTGAYTVNEIAQEARKMGLRARETGRPFHLTTLYKIFNNPFYMGEFKWKGETHKGRHEAMITADEFDLAQKILGSKGRPRSKRHKFAFTGMIRCGECGAMITAERKTKLIKGNMSLKSYTYYRCTHRKQVPCKQRAIRKEELERQVDKFLKKIQISEKLKDWAINHMKRKYSDEVEDRNKVLKTHQKAYNQVQKKIDMLLDMRLNETISDKEYQVKKKGLIKQKQEIKKQLVRTDQRADNWLETAERVFIFAHYARGWFKEGGIKTKKIILQTIGSHLTLKDKKLTIEPVGPFLVLAKRPKNCQWWR